MFHGTWLPFPEDLPRLRAVQRLASRRCALITRALHPGPHERGLLAPRKEAA